MGVSGKSVELHWPGKLPEARVLGETPCALMQRMDEGAAGCVNKLIKGENLGVMQALRRKFHLGGKIDLVYIDPPFGTNTVFRHHASRTATVSCSNGDDVAYDDTLLGTDFLEFLRRRLILLRELMAGHASIYLHIDTKIGHYVKVVMDEVFGRENCRSEITRVKCNPKNFARKGYGNIKDMVLFYSKTADFVWHEPREGLEEEALERLFPKVDGRGWRYTTTPVHAPGETGNGDTGKAWRGRLPPQGRHWGCDPAALDELDRQGLIEWSRTGNPRKIIYADEKRSEGKRVQDIWEYKDEPYPHYPTQKNLDMLKLIVRTSSDAGQMVLDAFCGSGTTLAAAQELERRWIGIDEAGAAIGIARRRLAAMGEGLFRPGYAYYEQMKAAAGRGQCTSWKG